MKSIGSAKERRATILQDLNENPEISIESMCKKFNVSEVTIRKDLNILHERNLLLRTRGGAIRLPNTNGKNNETSLKLKGLYNFKEKLAIGKFAASLIRDGETILLDSGTTTFEIAIFII